MMEINDGAVFTKEDIENNKILSGFGYFMFFLPLIAGYRSSFSRFHANQSLILLLFYLAGGLIFNFIPKVGWILTAVYTLLFIVLSVIGFRSSYHGEAKKLPVIGKFNIIKKPIGILNNNYTYFKVVETEEECI